MNAVVRKHAESFIPGNADDGSFIQKGLIRFGLNREDVKGLARGGGLVTTSFDWLVGLVESASSMRHNESREV